LFCWQRVPFLSVNVLTYFSSKRGLEYYMKNTLFWRHFFRNDCALLRITAVPENIFLNFMNETLRMKIIVFLAPAKISRYLCQCMS
jgi:hypothetical protein